MYASERIGLLFALCFSVLAGSSWAQAPSREQEQIRRLRQQVQQLQDERTAAQDMARKSGNEKKIAEEAKADLEGQTKRLGSSLEAVRNKAAAQTRRVNELEAGLAAIRTERDAIRAQQSDTTQRLAQERATLAQARAQQAVQQTQLVGQQTQLVGQQTQLAALGTQKDALSSQLDAAVRNNLALHALGLELLSRYEGKGVLESLSAREPFLQIKRVELENLVQDYRDKLDRQRVIPAKAL